MLSKKIDERKLPILLLVSTIAGFLFAITVISMFIFYDFDSIRTSSISFPLLITSTLSICVLTGCLVAYSLLSGFAKKEKKLQSLIKGTLRFLGEEERKIVLFLMDNGESNQNDIAKATRMSKVKVSRKLKNLEDKDIIFRETGGTSNKVKLNNAIKDLFGLY